MTEVTGEEMRARLLSHIRSAHADDLLVLYAEQFGYETGEEFVLVREDGSRTKPLASVSWTLRELTNAVEERRPPAPSKN